jgi:hypothetical protein
MLSVLADETQRVQSQNDVVYQRERRFLSRKSLFRRGFAVAVFSSAWLFQFPKLRLDTVASIIVGFSQGFPARKGLRLSAGPWLHILSQRGNPKILVSAKFYTQCGTIIEKSCARGRLD